MEKKTVKWLGLLAAVLSLLVVAIVAAGAVYLLLAPASSGPSPEEEYYRGMYDACAAITRQPAKCLEKVGQSRDRGWYEQPSPGWSWPLDTTRDAPLVSPVVPRDPTSQRLNEAM